MSEGPYHWCNDHTPHPTGAGVTTVRAGSALANGILTASSLFLARLEMLVNVGVLTPYDARQLLVTIGERPEAVARFDDGRVIPVSNR